ncbi:acyl-CoA synthetase family member 2, mitochondrial [Exaiptasia diaphana]|uniref:Acyl-CoA synthetase family member 2, mitochondrial n=1 Tax=Exaiptasia diaphana TaxID=2652724 RepID=A0A913Y108_EXADI|nr:acyl-CoA synthetase family member 2, mitochondrial [Exaiptasia diaphana]
MSKLSYEHNPLKSQYDGRLWYQLLDSKAEQYPDIEAVIMYDMDLNRSVMTFAEYRDRSILLATSLLNVGLSRGQRVLMIGRTSLPFMVFSMALNRIGCNEILLGPGMLTPDKVELLKTINCQLIAYDSRMNEFQKKQLLEGIKQLTQHNVDNQIKKQVLVSLSSVTEEVLNDEYHSYESLLVGGQSQSLQKLQDAQNEVQFDDPIVTMITSGSTGVPKIVQYTSHSILNYYAGSPFFLAHIPRETMYIDRPFSWAAGYIFCQSVLCSNTTLVWVPTERAVSETSGNSVFEIWEKEKCTFCSLSISLIYKLFADKLYLQYNLSQIKCFTLTGQRFSLEHFAKVFEMFPNADVMLLYGCTECPKIAQEIFGKGWLVEGKLGKLSLSSGSEIKVVDTKEKIVPRGMSGEICVRNSTVFLEYLDNPEATKQNKSPTGWFHTGDIGIMYDDGKIEVLGREKEIIKGAYDKVFPAEIEKVLLKHPSVADVCVVGVPDHRLHEEICACVVLKETEEQSCDEKIKKELQDWCKEQWPPGPDGMSLTPKYFLAMKSFPFTATGKVFRREIKAEAIKCLSL